MSSIFVTLVQTKAYTSASFLNSHSVSAAVPPLLAPLFVVEQVPVPVTNRERLVRVATVADLNDVGIPQNELQYFEDLGVDFNVGVVPQAGDILRINTPTEDLVYPAAPYLDFTVNSYSAQLLMLTTQPRLQVEGLTWDLLRGGIVQRSGTTGALRREQDIPGPFKCTAFTSMFETAAEGLNQLAAVRASVRSVVDAIKVSGPEYLAMSPGNPITTQYTE